jgi:hypothetical protein
MVLYAWHSPCGSFISMNDATQHSVNPNRHKRPAVRWQRGFLLAYRRAMRYGRRRLPRGVRALLGLVLIMGGVLGFLPILGFWMIPLGVGLLALDVPPLRRWIEHWLKRRAEITKRSSPPNAKA